MASSKVGGEEKMFRSKNQRGRCDKRLNKTGLKDEWWGISDTMRKDEGSHDRGGTLW